MNKIIKYISHFIPHVTDLTLCMTCIDCELSPCNLNPLGSNLPITPSTLVWKQAGLVLVGALQNHVVSTQNLLNKVIALNLHSRNNAPPIVAPPWVCVPCAPACMHQHCGQHLVSKLCNVLCRPCQKQVCAHAMPRTVVPTRHHKAPTLFSPKYQKFLIREIQP